MEIKKEVTMQYTLRLSEDEASWLMAVMQNPLGGQDPKHENPTESEMRHAFFEALRSVLLL